jgi:ATP-binding cassette subfamily F protein 3
MSASGLGLEFGADLVFEGLNFTVDRGDRVALVGINGAGKTSLMRIMTGELEPSRGVVTRSSGVRVGYLPQQLGEFPEGPLLDAVCRCAGEAVEALDRQKEILHSLSTPGEGRGALLNELASVQDSIDATGAYNLHNRAEAVLFGLGFTRDDLRKPMNEFSGGWKMRAMLGALILEDPDLLLLDEPTNHLDLDARIWLEEFLGRFKGAVWLISHDPGFLDRTVGNVYELEYGSLAVWSGNWSFYEKKKMEDIQHREREARKIEDQRERMERFVRKFQATESKRFQVRSRLKMLEKLETIETYRSPGRMRIRLPETPRSGRKVLNLEAVSKTYDHVVFQGVDLEIESGDRVGVVGRNGGGKSTLSRIMAGVEAPTSGTVKTGANVRIGYYSQEVDLALNPARTVLQQLSDVSPERSEKELRSFLGGFLFTGDDVEKPAGVLSGGEKSRVALARVMLLPTNFLILDEPTNHLDIFSRRVLAEVLDGYQGTLVLISHDENLIRALARRILVVDGGRVKPFTGGFDDFVEKRRQGASESLGSGKPRAVPPGRTGDKERKRREAQERNRLYQKRSRVEQRVRRIEREMAPLEKRKAEIEALLATPELPGGSGRIVELQKEHAFVTREMLQLEEQWLEAVEEGSP